jgi:DNA-binding beta-propeller fold protein YncE
MKRSLLVCALILSVGLVVQSCKKKSSSGSGSSCVPELAGGAGNCSLSLADAVTTLAGSGSSGSTNGTGTAASFNTPAGITSDGTNVYVADSGSNKIRQIVISTGVVTTLAGSGSAGSTNATGTAATFFGPAGVTTDGTNVYVADELGQKIRKIVISTGVVTTLAGSGNGYVDATGTSAKFNAPEGITTDGTNVYVADTGNQSIRKIVISTGVVTTFAGSTSGITDMLMAREPLRPLVLLQELPPTVPTSMFQMPVATLSERS